MGWSSYVTSTPNRELERIRAEQRAKRNKLDNCITQTNPIVKEIEQINLKIDKANQVVQQVKQIPPLVESSCTMLGAMGSQLQKGLKVNGVVAGTTVSSESTSIPAGISADVNNLVLKVQEYVSIKNQEGNIKKEQLESLKRQYNAILNSSPSTLGIYGPAPTFPNIPEIKTFQG